MMNDKMAIAIAKVVGKEVEIKTAEQDGKNIIVTAVTGDETYKAVLSERKNQYGAYYRVMSSEVIEVADEEPKEDVDEVEAMANLEAAKKFSEQKNAPVYVMSNGKRTVVIKTFVQGIIDSIIMDAGQVKQIIFKNGLSHTFIFK